MVLKYFTRTSAYDSAAAPEHKASAAAKLRSVQMGSAFGATVLGARDQGALQRTGFLGNPVGYRAVKMIAEAASNIPFQLRLAGGELSDHPALRVLRHPNPAQSGFEFFEALIGHLVLSGNGYVEAVDDDAGMMAEMYVLRSDRMRAVPGPDGWPKAFEYRVGERAHLFPNDPAHPHICHIRTFHPTDDHYGLAPIQAAAAAIDVHNAASRWAKALLDNAARPSGAIVYAGADGQSTLSADQYDRLIGELESHHQGARNAGRPMLLEGGLDWKPMGYSPNDMEFQKTKEAAAREIALAFGVPPMLLGLPGDATYANYQEAHRAFYRLTVLPLVNKVGAALSEFLSRRFDEDLALVPDLDQVTALAPEREAQWRRISEADFLTPDEKRQMLGLTARDPQGSETGADDAG